jgi:predicted kinase
MPSIHLIEGPVGAGKSTFAADLARKVSGVHVPLDEWFARLFSPDRPSTDFVSWYVEHKRRLLTLIWQHAVALLKAGTSPILELGLIRRADRNDFYNRVEDLGVDLLVYVLDLPREVRRERVRRRNAERGPTFSMVVPEPIFDMASDMWEAPDEDEIAERQIAFVSAKAEPDADAG